MDPATAAVYEHYIEKKFSAVARERLRKEGQHYATLLSKYVHAKSKYQTVILSNTEDDEFRSFKASKHLGYYRL